MSALHRLRRPQEHTAARYSRFRAEKGSDWRAGCDLQEEKTLNGGFCMFVCVCERRVGVYVVAGFVLKRALCRGASVRGAKVAAHVAMVGILFGQFLHCAFWRCDKL